MPPPPMYLAHVKTAIPEEFRDTSGSPLATFLGLFSVGLGLAEALDPKRMAELTGVRRPSLLAAYGVRELAAGVGILTTDHPAGWLWARVAGDVLDLATLAAAYAEARGHQDREKVLMAAAAVAGVTFLDVICAQANSRHSD